MSFLGKPTVEVVVATKNTGKLVGATHAVRAFLAKNNLALSGLVGYSTESGVADTPLSDEEGLVGCTNRIDAIKKLHPQGDLHLALEGVLCNVGGLWFVRGWTLMEDAATGHRVAACGAAVQVPDTVTHHIDSMDQFSERVKVVYDVTEEEDLAIRDIGANGVFSAGEYTRRDTFYDGVRICLAQLSNERNWPPADTLS